STWRTTECGRRLPRLRRTADCSASVIAMNKPMNATISSGGSPYCPTHLMQLSPSTQQVKPKTAKKIAVRSETRAFIGTIRIQRRGIGGRFIQQRRIFRVDDSARGKR